MEFSLVEDVHACTCVCVCCYLGSAPIDLPTHLSVQMGAM